MWCKDGFVVGGGFGREVRGSLLSAFLKSFWHGSCCHNPSPVAYVIAVVVISRTFPLFIFVPWCFYLRAWGMFIFIL
jgi:hypothetical protein